ncbi:MAG: hypothetical protein IPM66_10620 [Acidobacteriota bacterium]|nr:MAG: hypothetical protein IPM66_10620 [Acidobacteriota bacterium]
MNLLGIHLTVLIGPTVAVPAPVLLTEALQSVEVTHSDEERSGFKLTFQTGRTGLFDLIDYPILTLPLLRPFNRVILIATFNATPRVLMDGIITHQELSPGGEPGGATLSVMGEDVSVMMDLEEKSVEHLAQDETIIANKIIVSYAQFGMIPIVIPPVVIDPPIPVERTPVQQATDLGYLNEMAERHAYVFYVSPGPAPFTNTAYWGPPKRLDIPQRALSVNLGPESNVTAINFRNNTLDQVMIEGQVQDRTTNQTMPVKTFASTRTPLVSQPSWLVNQPNVRRRRFRAGGLNTIQAFARAQAMTDVSTDVVTAEGELEALRYNGLLQARGVVGLRGAGYSYDGLWYVKRVTHQISKGEYKQSFTLKREGVGAISPVVIP